MVSLPQTFSPHRNGPRNKRSTKCSFQAAHHFTGRDQVDQLIDASEDDPAMGFMAQADDPVHPAPHRPRRSASVQAR